MVDETVQQNVILMKRQVAITLVAVSSGFKNTKVIGLSSPHVSNGAKLEP